MFDSRACVPHGLILVHLAAGKQWKHGTASPAHRRTQSVSGTQKMRDDWQNMWYSRS